MKAKRSPASVLARLLELAKQRGEDYNLVLNHFGVERLLDRLSRSRHADRFLLKGALLFSIWYDQPHRATRDADLLGFGPADTDHLMATFRELAAIDLGDGIAKRIHGRRRVGKPVGRPGRRASRDEWRVSHATRAD